MLKTSLRRWLLLIAGLVLAGALAIAAIMFIKSDPVPWRVASVDVSGRSGAGIRLSLAGEGVPDGLRAMLVPEENFGGATGDKIDLSVPLYQFATDGQLAVASTRDQRLLTLDVTESRKPTVLGGLKLPSGSQPSSEKGINTLALSGSRVLVNRNNEGLILVEVSDPRSPRLIDSLEMRVRLLDVQTNGDVAYFASDTFGLVVVTFGGDRLDSRQVPGSLPASRITGDQRRLVTAGSKGDLALYHLGAPGRPELVGTVKIGEDIRDIALTPDVLYVCTATGQLLAFSLDAWPRPRLAGQLSLTGRPLKLEWLPATRNLLCTLVGSGVAVIDVSRIDTPQLAGVIALARVPVTVNINGNRAFLAGISGLKILSGGELLRVSPPQEIDYPFSPDSGPPSLFLWNSTAFAYTRSALKQLSAGNPEGRQESSADTENPPFLFLPDEHGVRLHALGAGLPTAEVVGRIPVSDPEREKYGGDSDQAKKILWRERRAYVLLPTKVAILEIDGSGRISSTEEFRPSGEMIDMAWLSPGYLLLAIYDQGLKVVDVRRPGMSRVVGEYPLPKHQRLVGAYKSLLVDGHLLYVARARLGVEVYDLSVPTSPRLLQRIDTPGHASDLALNDGLLLVTDTDHGVFVIDVSGRQAVAIGSYRLPTRAKEVLYDGVSLFMLNASGGVLRLPPPLRLARVKASSGTRANLTVPAGVAAGRYRLVLYDDETAVDLPVMLR